MANHSNFVSRERAAVGQLVDALETLRTMKRQWDSLGWNAGTLADAVGNGASAGSNGDLAAADVVSFITSAQAIDDFCTTNFHWAILEKART